MSIIDILQNVSIRGEKNGKIAATKMPFKLLKKSSDVIGNY